MFNLKAVDRDYRIGENVVHALNNVSMSISDGQFVTISGPSGCGKSTLLYTLGGLLTPSRGDVLYDDVNIYTLSQRDRAKFRRMNIGFVFQNSELIPYLTALENVMLPLSISKVVDEEQKMSAMDCLNKVGLSKRYEHRPSELSGGEQQRVAIARAIVQKPGIILADEPTGNLDSNNGKNIIQLLKALNEEGLTIVMVTHDKTLCKFADRDLTMLDGSLLNSES